MCNCNIDRNTLVEGMSEFNLYDEFHDANKKYFNNRLRLDFPLAYKKRSGAFGWVKARMTKRSGRIVEADIMGLFINSDYRFTKEQFLSTFLHEMCHVAMLQDADKYTWRGGYHGEEWKDIAAEVSKAAGVVIQEKNAAHEHEREDARKAYVVILKVPKSPDMYKTPSISTMAEVTWEKSKTHLLSILPQYADMGYHVYILKTKDTTPKSFARDSRGRVKFYRIPNDKFHIVNKVIERDDTEVLHSFS